EKGTREESGREEAGRQKGSGCQKGGSEEEITGLLRIARSFMRRPVCCGECHVANGARESGQRAARAVVLCPVELARLASPAAGQRSSRRAAGATGGGDFPSLQCGCWSRPSGAARLA